MEIIKGFNHLYKQFKKPVVTIGTFDGIHLGHQKIIKKVVSEARRINGTSIVITFDKRPVTVFPDNMCHDMLMSLNDKIEKIKNMGINVTVIVNFNKRIAKIRAANFIKNILHEKLHIKELIVGPKFRFGRNREGGIDLFKKMSVKYGFRVKVVDEKKYNNTLISSTRIRELIRSGSLGLAVRFLGYRYSVSGYVVRGDKRGKILGFPTANVKYNTERLVPQGVYVVYVEVDKKKYKGICNVGIRPTFATDGCVKSRISERLRCDSIIEVHIFNLKKDIYKKQIKIIFVKKVRDEKVFSNYNDLVKQIKKDINIAQKILSSKISLQSA